MLGTQHPLLLLKSLTYVATHDFPFFRSHTEKLRVRYLANSDVYGGWKDGGREREKGSEKRGNYRWKKKRRKGRQEAEGNLNSLATVGLWLKYADSLNVPHAAAGQGYHLTLPSRGLFVQLFLLLFPCSSLDRPKCRLFINNPKEVMQTSTLSCH